MGGERSSKNRGIMSMQYTDVIILKSTKEEVQSFFPHFCLTQSSQATPFRTHAGLQDMLSLLNIHSGATNYAVFEEDRVFWLYVNVHQRLWCQSRVVQVQYRGCQRNTAGLPCKCVLECSGGGIPQTDFLSSPPLASVWPLGLKDTLMTFHGSECV